MLVVTTNDLVFRLGLAVSNMARSEVVLDSLQLDDLGPVFVMGRVAVVTSTVFALAEVFGDHVPLVERDYGRQLRSLDKNVVVGGIAFGAD